MLGGQFAQRGFHLGVALSGFMHVSCRQGQSQALVQVVREVDAVSLGVQGDQFLIVQVGVTVQLEDLPLLAIHGHGQGRAAMIARGVHGSLHMHGSHEQRRALVELDRRAHLATVEFLFMSRIEEVLPKHPIELVQAVLQASEGNGVIGKGFHVSERSKKADGKCRRQTHAAMRAVGSTG